MEKLCFALINQHTEFGSFRSRILICVGNIRAEPDRIAFGKLYLLSRDGEFQLPGKDGDIFHSPFQVGLRGKGAACLNHDAVRFKQLLWRRWDNSDSGPRPLSAAVYPIAG